jgi:RNA polymerase sigma-70 factor (ECF subfamily)
LSSKQTADAELVKRAQAGDKRAFDLLVLKYQYKIIGLIGRYVKDSHEVMDVSQDAFIKAYRALDNFRGESQFYTWLYRIAINTAKNYLLAKARRPFDVDVASSNNVGEHGQYDQVDMIADSATPANLLVRDQLHEQIFATLEKLPIDLKSALTLREFDGLTF